MYVHRNDAAAIAGVFANRQEGYAEEFLEDAAQEVVAFLASVAVPNSCTKLGLKRGFDELGTWSTVKAAIAADSDAQEEWDLAIEIKRTDPLVQHMIAAMSLTSEQVDNLLIRANALV